jgi:nitroreductase
MMKKYPAKADLFVTLEVGHATENLLLEATALGLAAVPAGGFVPADVQQGLSLPADEKPIYLIPVGYGK